MYLTACLLLQGFWWLSLASVTYSFPFNERDSASIYSEQLLASQLIGSHFGVPDLSKAFDYVIIGGGTAGLVIAERLAANSTYSVAVIEAGGFYELDNGNYSQIPAFAPQFTPGAFQKWADVVSDSSYTFDRLLPFFKRSVSFHAPNTSETPANVSLPFEASSFSLTGGPLQVSFPRYFNAFSSWLGSAFQELGISRLPGFSDGRLFGWSYITYTVDPSTQTRSSSETSFLRQSLGRTDNLYFYKSSLVKRIIFDDCKTAIGVSVDTGGVEYTISANKEVILSAGSFRSPQLLMVSGIGPSSTLDPHNITVCVDRPGVGQNMWDNAFFGLTHPVDVATHNRLANPGVSGAAVTEYNSQRTGILTNSGGDAIAFEKLPNSSLSTATRRALDDAYGPDWPDVEYLSFDAYFGDRLLPPPPETIGKNYAALLAGLTAPFSRGNVTIASSDTSVLPIVSPNWLADPRDREVLITAVRRARQVWATKAMQDVITGPEIYPGANVTSDADLIAVIQRSTQTIWHACATNKMGKRDDPLAVVDSKARVIGVEGLRVVDASAFPFLPPGQPQSMVYALAEKIAQHILDGE
ncbi:MAG: hypothetical protein Q9190_004057 [Brigantiaea leucoxantha]